MAAVDLLQVRRKEIGKRLKELETLLPQARLEIEHHRTVMSSRSWIRRVFDEEGRKQLSRLAHQAFRFEKEERDLRRELSDIASSLRQRRQSIRREAEARESAQLRNRRAQIEAERLHAFANASKSTLEQPFRREDYVIQKADYRRGNRVDNYCRSKLWNEIVRAFDGQCACCGGIEGLTLDHYGLTKNEGGNFFLITRGSGALRVNLVVLCRSCNATKAQMPHDHFFGEEQRQHIVECQERVLSTALADSDFRGLIQGRYR